MSNLIAVSAFFVRVTYTLPVCVPVRGGPSGGTAVTILGSFVDGCTVTFGGELATEVVVTDGVHLTCVTPAHDLGVVSVVITNPDASDYTIDDGFEYAIIANIGPVIDAGPTQIAVGPLPSTVTTQATAIEAASPIASYAWEQLGTGPAWPTIVDSSALNTDIVFDTYAPGTYTFQLTVTDAQFTVTDTMHIVIRETVAPAVSGGRRQLVWAP